jgi:hypothetical protein
MEKVQKNSVNSVQEQAYDVLVMEVKTIDTNANRDPVVKKCIIF